MVVAREFPWPEEDMALMGPPPDGAVTSLGLGPVCHSFAKRSDIDEIGAGESLRRNLEFSILAEVSLFGCF